MLPTELSMDPGELAQLVAAQGEDESKRPSIVEERQEEQKRKEEQPVRISQPYSESLVNTYESSDFEQLGPS